MKTILRTILPAILLCLGESAFAFRVSSVYEANTLCSYPYSCNSEQIAADNRPMLRVDQPVNADIVKGSCSNIPRAQSYMARPTGLTCGTAETVRSRGMIDHPQEKLDSNLDILNTGDRARAQKALLVDFKLENALKFSVRESWVYKRKVGGYGCGGSFGVEGGGREEYQTTCYRTGRSRKAVQRVVKRTKYCAVATPAPAPSPSPSPSYGGGGYSSGGSSGGGYSPSPSPSPRPAPSPSPQPKGDREKDQSDRLRRGFDSGSVFNYFAVDYRSPAQHTRVERLRDKVINDSESAPYHGCDRWDTRTDYDRDVEVDISEPDISYSCVKVRSKWCTWYEDQGASQICPEQKTANVTVQYVTPKNWYPGGDPKYDDQLPNKHDLLIGESELIKVSANTSISSTMTPAIRFANATTDSFGKVREKTWNEYKAEIVTPAIKCEYKDQDILIKVHTVGRNVQASPNPLLIPKDANGNDAALSGTDSRGRPSLLTLINPGRNMVLDRSNISRIFGESSTSSNDGMSTSTITNEKKTSHNAGITKKFWENTKFFMRLVWFDGKDCGQDPSKCRLVRVTQNRRFNLNQAGIVGDTLEVSLESKRGGMDNFYKITLPFDDLFAALAADYALDPKKDYYLEIKLAQPYFQGIYLDGRVEKSKRSDDDAKIDDNDAYSEPKYILLRAPEAKRSLWEAFWHWRSNRIWRP